MVRRVVLAVLVLSLAAGALGCGGYVGRARRDYDDGLFLEAAEQLGRHEAELAKLSPRRQADYGLYRGLSLMELGDLGGAHRWLSFAYDVERRSPGAMKPEDRATLDRGWARLAMLLQSRVAPPPPPPPAEPAAPVPAPAPPPPGWGT